MLNGFVYYESYQNPITLEQSLFWPNIALMLTPFLRRTLRDRTRNTSVDSFTSCVANSQHYIYYVLL